MKKLIPMSIFIFSWVLSSCGPTPVSKDRVNYLGQWKSQSGFLIEIKADGTANIMQKISRTESDYENLCIKVGPPIIKDLNVNFINDSTLEVLKPTLYGKVYKISKAPFRDQDNFKMILNNVELTKQ
jgi:hypothetical protein